MIVIQLLASTETNSVAQIQSRVYSVDVIEEVKKHLKEIFLERGYSKSLISENLERIVGQVSYVDNNIVLLNGNRVSVLDLEEMQFFCVKEIPMPKINIENECLLEAIKRVVECIKQGEFSILNFPFVKYNKDFSEIVYKNFGNKKVDFFKQFFKEHLTGPKLESFLLSLGEIFKKTAVLRIQKGNMIVSGILSEQGLLISKDIVKFDIDAIERCVNETFSAICTKPEMDNFTAIIQNYYMFNEVFPLPLSLNDYGNYIAKLRIGEKTISLKKIEDIKYYKGNRDYATMPQWISIEPVMLSKEEFEKIFLNNKKFCNSCKTEYDMNCNDWWYNLNLNIWQSHKKSIEK